MAAFAVGGPPASHTPPNPVAVMPRKFLRDIPLIRFSAMGCSARQACDPGWQTGSLAGTRELEAGPVLFTARAVRRQELVPERVVQQIGHISSMPHGGPVRRPVRNGDGDGSRSRRRTPLSRATANLCESGPAGPRTWPCRYSLEPSRVWRCVQLPLLRRYTVTRNLCMVASHG